ncbi:MAG: T9SS type A sorting domain-containing protein [Bacteroidia bacterium]
MMKKALVPNIFYLLAFTLYLNSTNAQLLRYCTTLHPGSGGFDTIAIGLQSLADTAVPIRAISFSFVYDSSCSDFDNYLSILEGSGLWGNFLAKDSLQKPFSVQYQGKNYSARFFYGNADPRPSQPNPAIIPASSEQPRIIFKAVFQGNCLPEIYMESQIENPVNQIGSVNNNAIPFDVSLNTCAPVGIEPEAFSRLSFFPNPSSGAVHFQSADPVFIEIFDQNGKLVLGEKIETQASFSLKEKGLFLVKIKNLKGLSATKKLLIY